MGRIVMEIRKELSKKGRKIETNREREVIRRRKRGEERWRICKGYTLVNTRSIRKKRGIGKDT